MVSATLKIGNICRKIPEILTVGLHGGIWWCSSGLRLRKAQRGGDFAPSRPTPHLPPSTSHLRVEPGGAIFALLQHLPLPCDPHTPLIIELRLHHQSNDQDQPSHERNAHALNQKKHNMEKGDGDGDGEERDSLQLWPSRSVRKKYSRALRTAAVKDARQTCWIRSYVMEAVPRGEELTLNV